MLLGPSSWSTILDDELSLRQFSSSYHFALNRKLGFELCRTLGSNNLSLHHSFDLVSSLIDYVFLKSLDKCAVIIINLYELFQDINRIHDEKYHPCPRWFVLSSATLLPYLQHKHDVFCIIPWVPCYPAFVLNDLGILPPLCQECRGNFATSLGFLV